MVLSVFAFSMAPGAVPGLGNQEFREELFNCVWEVVAVNSYKGSPGYSRDQSLEHTCWQPLVDRSALQRMANRQVTKWTPLEATGLRQVLWQVILKIHLK